MLLDGVTFVREIESLLARLGRQKEEFYENSKISSATFSQYRTGLYNPSRRTVRKAVAYLSSLGVNAEYLLSDNQKEKPNPENEVELSPVQQEAWDTIKDMDDATLKRFIAAAKALLGEDYDA